MSASKRLDKTSVPGNTERLALYETYGAMAYGVILQIIPQPELAQQVLVDLFIAPQIEQCIGSMASPGCSIVRLARTKALEASRVTGALSAPLSDYKASEKETAEKLVFDLSFRQGHSLGTIAERLQIPYSDVMKSIRNYFKYLRTS
ncbi:hypothetical protein [Spirosoma agri]|uniref:Sigma-70 family RNA polymerase sigma factor n=1 Tax=Spirosoma agri TaxID=1987381 RepID=A0A6M0IF58_9BACT|nr:hypothetical protein [Spirosoma agri]NEU65703.1 hypothetical protein [Spirosoma agri]